MNPNAELIAGLRQLADYLESHRLKEVASQTVHVFARSREEFAEQLRAMGTADKLPGDEWFYAIKNFGPVELKLCIERKQLCERVKVGEKVIPAQPERTLPATPEKIEEVFEWKCPESILKPHAIDPANALAHVD